MMSRVQLKQYATIFRAYVTTKVSNLHTCGTAIKIANTVTKLLCTVGIKEGNIVQCNLMQCDCDFMLYNF